MLPGTEPQGQPASGDPTVGVYVHVPFCDRVCPYCDFAVVGGGVTPQLETRYVDALIRELSASAEAFGGTRARLESLYLGGGTPSLLSAEAVSRLVDAVRARFAGTVGAEPEITLEVNPSTVERARLPRFAESSVNRLSIGVQSFDDDVLRRLGRAHRAEEAHRTLAAARDAGFDNVSLDLLFAAPGQRLLDLEADLAAALAHAPEHVSTYELVVEEGTPFAGAAARGQLPRADSDEAALMIERIGERLTAAGLRRYELTNHARPGRESRHNLRYWQREPVLGLGVGAWSCLPRGVESPHGGRRANVRELGKYLARIEAGESTVVEEERLDPATARGEAMFLGLRSGEVRAERFAGEFGAPPRAWFAREIDALRRAGLIAETDSGDLSLTARGELLADEVCEKFV